VLTDGDTGWMVPSASPIPLADALDAALTHPDEARRRGDRARQVTLEQRGIGAMVRRHEEFYRSVAER
jgi:glycosyltransferase involved in cell wall biosynthesis